MFLTSTLIIGNFQYPTELDFSQTDYYEKAIIYTYNNINTNYVIIANPFPKTKFL